MVFTTFRYGVDLNRWLELNGYLVVDDAKRDAEFLAGVDWSRTAGIRAGTHRNIHQHQGKVFPGEIVDAGAEAEQLREEITGKLSALVDPKANAPAVKRVYIAPRLIAVRIRANAPDLIVGYQHGYRASWETAIGRTTREVFLPNTKGLERRIIAWTSRLVPGIMFCNRKIDAEHPR